MSDTQLQPGGNPTGPAVAVDETTIGGDGTIHHPLHVLGVAGSYIPMQLPARTVSGTLPSQGALWLVSVPQGHQQTVVMTLPAAADNFRTSIAIKSINGGHVDVAAGAGDTIDGAASFGLVNHQTLVVQSDGVSTWQVISSYVPA